MQTFDLNQSGFSTVRLPTGKRDVKDLNLKPNFPFNWNYLTYLLNTRLTNRQACYSGSLRVLAAIRSKVMSICVNNRSVGT